MWQYTEISLRKINRKPRGKGTCAVCNAIFCHSFSFSLMSGFVSPRPAALIHTSGCTATTYCHDRNTTRAEMAVFIIRSMFGGDTFAFPATPYFTDVPTTHQFYQWIQKMRELGITAGCTASTYCPNDAVTRGQMAVFIIRARLRVAAGETFPFIATPFFTDVGVGHLFFSYIQKMREIGVTAGCTANQYCPETATTRGQMAVFIIRGLLTP